MDPDVPPQVYVMLVAWYGVSSTGNQSAEGLERLVTLVQDQYPAAVDVIKVDRYVDDVLSGGNTKEEVDCQVNETTAALKEGGFNAFEENYFKVLPVVLQCSHDPNQKEIKFFLFLFF